MKALTIWQPWASLIVAGAKPYEFRRWSFAAKFPALVGERIVIHAGSRPARMSEVLDVIDRIESGESALDAAIATPMLQRLIVNLTEAEADRQAWRKATAGQRALAAREESRVRRTGEPYRLPPLPPKPPNGQPILSAGLGTAVLGTPVRAVDLFADRVNDSDRIDHKMWAWPMLEIEPFDAPEPQSGAQGFWNWS